jgi:LacI family transcriptional regulator, galactose operon repressor
MGVGAAGMGHQRRSVLVDRIANQRGFAFIALDEHDISIGLGVSAVVRDPQEIGRQAARLAIERIADREGPPRTVTLPSILVRRGTGEIPAERVPAEAVDPSP